MHSTARQTCYVVVMRNAVPVAGELARHTVNRTVSGNGSLHTAVVGENPKPNRGGKAGRNVVEPRRLLVFLYVNA